MNEKIKLFKQLTELSFVMDDLRLYLDTHPCDQEALCYFKQIQVLRSNTLQEYTENYGPIYNYDVDVDNYFCWVNDPWPWEGVC